MGLLNARPETIAPGKATESALMTLALPRMAAAMAERRACYELRAARTPGSKAGPSEVRIAKERAGAMRALTRQLGQLGDARFRSDIAPGRPVKLAGGKFLARPETQTPGYGSGGDREGEARASKAGVPRWRGGTPAPSPVPSGRSGAPRTPWASPASESSNWGPWRSQGPRRWRAGSHSCGDQSPLQPQGHGEESAQRGGAGGTPHSAHAASRRAGRVRPSVPRAKRGSARVTPSSSAARDI